MWGPLSTVYAASIYLIHIVNISPHCVQWDLKGLGRGKFKIGKEKRRRKWFEPGAIRGERIVVIPKNEGRRCKSCRDWMIEFDSSPLPSYLPYWPSSWLPLALVLPHCGNHSDTGGSQVPSTVACEADQSPPGIAERLPQAPDQGRSRNPRFLGWSRRWGRRESNRASSGV